MVSLRLLFHNFFRFESAVKGWESTRSLLYFATILIFILLNQNSASVLTKRN